jgi:DNA modification methylase
MDLSVFSPPFADLYVYSDNPRDMGNSRDYKEFFQHFSFLIPELLRVIKPGREVCVHCMYLPILKGKEGYVGVRDFPGMLIRAFEDGGFILHSPPITVWKNPVTEMQRTKSLRLLHKQLKKDSTMSGIGCADHILIFRKPGDNEVPVQNTSVPVELWQKIASPVWGEGLIDFGNTLNYRAARDNNDERHIAPLSLDIIKYLVLLYSNKGETVFSPFAGIASEGYQSILMGRNFTGFEIKKSYFDQGEKNLQSAKEKLKQENMF